MSQKAIKKFVFSLLHLRDHTNLLKAFGVMKREMARVTGSGQHFEDSMMLDVAASFVAY